MTTPRVTVPPQALEAIAFNLCSLHDFDVAFVRENERFATAVITEYVRSLSAAPAPEGGVVLAKRVSPGEAINRAVGDEVLTAKALESITTAGWVFAHKDDIATREVAPAEAGETIEARFPELNDDLIRMASTGSTGSLIEWGAFIERLKSALRAQPQAREEAQQVAWRSIGGAPKDGTTIDVWCVEGGRETVFWGYPHHECGEMGSLCDSDWHSLKEPGWVCATFNEFIGGKHNPFTHWKPVDGGPSADSAHPATDAQREASLWWNAEDWEQTFDSLEDAYDAATGGEMRGVAKLGRATEHDPVWALRIDLDTTGDGETDDYEIRLFKSAGEAHAYLAALQAEQKGGA